MEYKRLKLDDPNVRFIVSFILDIGLWLWLFHIQLHGYIWLLAIIIWIVCCVTFNIWQLWTENFTRLPQILSLVTSGLLVYAAKSLFHL